MGILDDAIRQHLELKRKHGVPEEELQRQEEEALGPARRDVAQHAEETELAPGQTATAQVDEPAPAAAEQETALFDMEQPDAEPPADEPPASMEPLVSEPEAADAAFGEDPVADPHAHASEAPPGEAPPAEPPPSPEPEPSEPTPVEPPPVEPPPESAEPAADFFEPDDEPEDHDDPLAAEPGDEDLDVLEDTPDFLQETPEHDRLWFEQKPPRDFDFD